MISTKRKARRLSDELIKNLKLSIPQKQKKSRRNTYDRTNKGLLPTARP